MNEIKNFFNIDRVSDLIPFLRESIGIYMIFAFLFIAIFILILMFTKSGTREKNSLKVRKQPNLEDIIETNDIKVNEDNEFVDVLVAIEEEMIAIRELYVGGYISKGVYISETDRLYEKAKIFGV